MTLRTFGFGLLACSLAATSAWAVESPYIKPDGSWISLSGTVANVGVNGFALDYGPDEVRVEMENWDWYDGASSTLEGERVTVYGEVDDDTYETASVEAKSIFVEGMGTQFYASPTDNEPFVDLDMTPTTPVVVGDFTLTGTITNVYGREFTLDSGVREVTVDTSTMDYNPLGDEGPLQLNEGDLVTVSGSSTEMGFFENREVVAEAVLKLQDIQGP